MQIDSSKIDYKFKGYKLKTKGLKSIVYNIETTCPLKQLEVVGSTERVKWNSRIHYNGLFSSCFDDQGKTLFYYIDENCHIVQIEYGESNETIKVESVFQIQSLIGHQDERNDHVKMYLVSQDRAVVFDGIQTLLFLDRKNEQWKEIYTYQPFKNREQLFSLLGACWDEKLDCFQCAVLATKENHPKQKGQDKFVFYNLTLPFECRLDIQEQQPKLQVTLDSLIETSETFDFVQYLASSKNSAVGMDLVVLTKEKHQILVPFLSTKVCEKDHSLKDMEHQKHLASMLPIEISNDEAPKQYKRPGIGFNSQGSTHNNDYSKNRHLTLDQRFQSSSSQILFSKDEGTVDDDDKHQIHHKEKKTSVHSVPSQSVFSQSVPSQSVPSQSVFSQSIPSQSLQSIPSEPAKELEKQNFCHNNTTFGSFSKIGIEKDEILMEKLLAGFEECDIVDAREPRVLYHFKSELTSQNDTFQLNWQVQEKKVIDPLDFSFLASMPNEQKKQVILFQNDIHGVGFTMDLNNGLQLIHTLTFNAFGFVQASKQDKKFITFDPDGKVAVIAEFDNRIYFFSGRSNEEKHIPTKDQYIKEIGNETILGIQMVDSKSVLVLTPFRIFHIEILDHDE